MARKSEAQQFPSFENFFLLCGPHHLFLPPEINTAHPSSLSLGHTRLHNPRHHLPSLVHLDLRGGFTCTLKEAPISLILPPDPFVALLIQSRALPVPIPSSPQHQVFPTHQTPAMVRLILYITLMSSFPPFPRVFTRSDVVSVIPLKRST